MSMSMDEELICIKHLFKKWILPTRAFKKFYEWSIIFKDQLTEKKTKKTTIWRYWDDSEC